MFRQTTNSSSYGGKPASGKYPWMPQALPGSKSVEYSETSHPAFGNMYTQTSQAPQPQSGNQKVINQARSQFGMPARPDYYTRTVNRQMGGMGGGQGTGGGGNVSSTSPQIYNSDQSLMQTNQAVVQNQMRTNPDQAMKQFDRGGVSRDDAQLSSALPGIAASNSAAARARYEMPLQHQLLNSAYAADVQGSQGAEALDMFNLLRRQQQIQDYTATSMISPLLQALVG